MDEWEEYYKKPNNNFTETPNQQETYSTYYFGYLNDYTNGNNMSPRSYDECFIETTATTNLKKWTRIFKICLIVLFVILSIGFFVNAFESSHILVEGEYSWSKPTEKFSMGYFIGQLLGYGIVMFVMFLSYKLTFAVLSCIAQITRNTGISAKLAAFNTKSQMMKAHKDRANRETES